MANETELERLVVRLTGDGASFQSMMTTAQSQTTQTVDTLKKADKESGSFFQGVGEGLTKLVAAWGIKSWLGEAKSAYDDQIGAERQLNAMLVANQRETKGLFDRYKEFSEEIQNSTGFADDNVLGLLKQAEAMGLTGRAAEQAVKNYVAIEAAGLPMRGGLRALVALEQGHSEMLARTFPALRDITNETERAAEAQRILDRMYGLAEQSGKRAGTQLKVAWSELMEEFGKPVHELMKPITEIKLAFVNVIREIPPEIKQAMVFVGALSAVTLSAVAAFQSAAFFAGLIGSGVILALIPIAAIGAGVSLIVSALGGIPAVWAMIKNAAAAVWDSDIVKSFRELVVGTWTALKNAALDAWDWISERVGEFVAAVKPMFDDVVSVLGAAWKFVSDTIVGAFNYAKEGINRFYVWILPLMRSIGGVISTAWQLALELVQAGWGYLKETIVAVWEVIKNGWEVVSAFVGGFFGSAGESLSEFFTNWRDFFIGGFLLAEYTVRNFGQVWEAAVAFATYKGFEFFNTFIHFFRVQLPEVIVWFFDNWQSLWTSNVGFAQSIIASLMRGEMPDFAALRAGLVNQFAGLNLTPRVEGQEEQRLRLEWERVGGRLGEDFDRFMARRLPELFGPATDRTAYGPGGRVRGEDEKKSTGRELQKVEAVLFGSADAAFRVQSQFMRFGLPERTQAQNIAAIADRAAVTNQILNQINRGVNQMAENPPVQVQGANL